MTGAAVVTLGETMGLMRAASVGSLEHVSDFRLHIGGAESNVAIGAARLGRPAVWMGRVGDDGIGRRVLRELRAEGVTLHATVDDAARTGLMLKETPRAGSTRVLYYRAGSAGSRLNAADLDLGAIASAGILHVTGITLALSDSAEHAVFAAIDAAVTAGVPVSFDVNHRSSLWGAREAAPVYRRIAERATIVFAGDEEAELPSDRAHPKSWRPPSLPSARPRRSSNSASVAVSRRSTARSSRRLPSRSRRSTPWERGMPSSPATSSRFSTGFRQPSGCNWARDAERSRASARATGRACPGVPTSPRSDRATPSHASPIS